MDIVASVVISNSAREFDMEYHYLVPENLKDRVRPGMRVIVPFGKSDRLTEGYVLDVFELKGKNEEEEASPAPGKSSIQLKYIKKAVDEKPLLSTNMIRLASWMKDRYICTYSDALKCMLPPGIGVKSIKVVKLQKDGQSEGNGHSSGSGQPAGNDQAAGSGRAIGNDQLAGSGQPKGKNAARILQALNEAGGECEYEELKARLNIRTFSKAIKDLEEAGLISIYEEFTSRVREKTVKAAFIALPREEIIEEIESNRIRRIQHIRVLEMLLDTEYISVQDIVRFAGVSPGVLNTLKKYGYIDFKDVEVIRDPYRDRDYPRTRPLTPTPSQAAALKELRSMVDANRFHEVLLHGVTGSGKTEVYLQLIQYCLDKGRQAIVLVPEISLTPQMVERFKGRFGERVAVLHSRLSPGERYDQWRMIKDGEIKVAVGARSAVFAPFDNLGVIIIDEEHETTYKSETTPKYHARDIAKQRCMAGNALLVYGSATPSIETYYRAQRGEISLLELTERANRGLLPHTEIIDMRRELDSGNRSMFSSRLAVEIEKNIKSGQQTMLFLNRRGYASFVLCRKCGLALTCPNCSISLTYHAYDDRLICHYCGYTVKNPETCPRCKSRYIRHFGTGTQKVEEELAKHFPGCTVIRMDMDTTTYKNSHEEILTAFREKNINIMVGTQMIAKGHDFPNVTLVGVLAADGMLNTGDYRASERTFQLITQVAGRAGRGELPGRVIIQAYNTEDFSINAACRHDYKGFYSQEIRIRKKLWYPPFTNLACVILSGPYDRAVAQKAREVAKDLGDCFKDFGQSAQILGPARAPLSRIKNKFRWRIIIKCPDLEGLVSVLTHITDEYGKSRGKSNIDLSVDINPVNML